MHPRRLTPSRRLLLDWSVPAGLACVVVAFAAGSASLPRVKSAAHDVRWVILALVGTAALVDALRRLWPARRLPPVGLMRFGALVGAFLALAVASTAWSATPLLTFERAGSLGMLFVLGAALASSTSADVGARVRLFQGLAVGAVVVAILGLVVLVVDYDAAVLQASSSSPWRYRGFTENPNTVSILAGAALPILVGLAIRAANRRHQAAWLAGALLLLASIIAAESRGGLLAACAGTLVVATFGFQGQQRLAAVATLLTVFAGGIALRQVTEPSGESFTSQVAAVPGPTPATSPEASSNPGGSAENGKTTKPPSTRKAPASKAPPPIVRLHTQTQVLPREEDEIGHPLLSKQATTTLASGRIAAWKGALDLIADRPIVGYGFGTEQRVFIDRWYFFQGSTPENSYLGLLLQLGVVGLALFTAIGLALVLGGVRAVRTFEGDERLLALIELGVLVAAAAIMLVQSYLYSVGNIASATVWISLFLLAPVALASRPRPARLRATAERIAA